MSDASPDPPPFNPRRDFFRRLLLRGLDKAEDATRAVGERFERAMAPPPTEAPPWPGAPAHALRDIPGHTIARGSAIGAAAGDTSEASAEPPLRYLRPPGALPEVLLGDVCSRCGECVRACPAQCIRLDPLQARGLPHIVARQSPCVVCDDLSCMKVCPTGALKLVDSPAEIRMGVAVVDHARCLRTPAAAAAVPREDEVTAGAEAGGEDCRLCISPCPFGEAAIGLDGRGRIEVRGGCTGCGLCERACPTEPTSIWVERRVG